MFELKIETRVYVYILKDQGPTCGLPAHTRSVITFLRPRFVSCGIPSIVYKVTTVYTARAVRAKNTSPYLC